MEVLADGSRVELGGGRQRALLALLLLHVNEVVSTDRLVDELWGEHPPATAVKALQGHVSQLRRSLAVAGSDGTAVLATRPPGYVLNVAPEGLDSLRFEDLLGRARQLLPGDPKGSAELLREALALWRGRPLDEFAYEPFAEAEVARLEELRLRALEERADADLALGRHADLVGELERLVSENPLRERLRGQLMLALCRSGRQAEALQVYQDGRRLLADELGLPPGAALQQLEKQILDQDPALQPPPHVPLAKEERPQVPRPSGETKRRGVTTALWSRPRRLVAGLAALALATAAAAAILLTRDGRTTPTVVPTSIVKIDPRTNTVTMIEGRVIRILDHHTVIINVGQRHGVQRGMRFGIYTPNEAIVDPETGANLGTHRSRKATVEARNVYARFTVAVSLTRTRRVSNDTTERVQDELPVDTSQLQPLPTGSEVRVGDRVEILGERSPKP